eukprot:7174483-Pyramimonas_sp.AAC.1
MTKRREWSASQFPRQPLFFLRLAPMVSNVEPPVLVGIADAGYHTPRHSKCLKSDAQRVHFDGVESIFPIKNDHGDGPVFPAFAPSVSLMTA